MRKYYAVLLAIFLCNTVFSESSFFDNYVYQSWSAFGGLSGTTANDIYQTRDGYIDIGTYEGLVKFDGVEFTTINRSTEKEFTFVSVRTIIQDSRGDIWLLPNQVISFIQLQTDFQIILFVRFVKMQKEISGLVLPAALFILLRMASL